MAAPESQHQRDRPAHSPLRFYQINDTTPESDYSQDSEQQSNVASSTPSKAEKKPRVLAVDYKPTALRWWFHLTLIVCLATLIGLTEYAIRVLDIHQSGSDNFVSAAVKSRSFEPEFGDVAKSSHVLSRRSPVDSKADSSSYVRTEPRQTSDDPGVKLHDLETTPHWPEPGETTDYSRKRVLPTPNASTGHQSTERSFPTLSISDDLEPFEAPDHYLQLGRKTVFARDRALPSTTGSDRDAAEPVASTGPPDDAVTQTSGSQLYLHLGTTTVFEARAPYSIMPAATNSPDSGSWLSSLLGQEGVGGDARARPDLYLQPGKTTVLEPRTPIYSISASSAGDLGQGLNRSNKTSHATGLDVSPGHFTLKTGKTSTIKSARSHTETQNPLSEAPMTQQTETIVDKTTIGGTTQKRKATFTNSHGNVTSSLYTEVIGGTPTSTTLVIVQATSIPSGRGAILSILPLAIPVTSGGKTEVRTTLYTDAHGKIEPSTYTTVLSPAPTSTTFWVLQTPTSKPISPSVPSGGNSSSGTGPTSQSGTKAVVYGVSVQAYVVGTFLPTVLAVLIAFPIKLISINARLMQPFHALATAESGVGARPEASIFLRFYGLHGLTAFPRAIRLKQPVVALADALALSAGLLAPLAAETVSVYAAVDACESYCRGNLGSSVRSGRALQGVLAAMIACLLALMALLGAERWRTGVAQNPWSIAGMAGLLSDPELRRVLCAIPGDKGDSAILKVLAGRGYALGDTGSSWDWRAGGSGYGVIVAGRGHAAKSITDDDMRQADSPEPQAKKTTQPFMLLTWWGRCIMLFIFLSVLAIVVYYEESSGSTGFEDFMDSQGYGVEFFFTALGVILGYCTETVFRCVAIMSPYLQMRDRALPAERSILPSPPTNAVSGLRSALRQRHAYLALAALASLLAELALPVALSRVPFSAAETFATQVACAWLAAAVLGLAVLSIAASFLVRWPHMPVDPRTVAGAMYYACDSWMVQPLGGAGVAVLGTADRDLEVRYLRHRYGYGRINGMSGRGRVGVDIVDDRDEEAAAAGGRKPEPQYVWVL